MGLVALPSPALSVRVGFDSWGSASDPYRSAHSLWPAGGGKQSHRHLDHQGTDRCGRPLKTSRPTTISHNRKPKKPWSMSEPLSRVYFTDRDLGKQFGAILRSGGLHVERHADHFAHDTADEV